MDNSELTVELDGQTSTIEWPSGKKLLDTMLDAGLDAPFGCTHGQCGACQCVVESDDSTTSMDNNEVLDDYDVNDDIRLACQTRADSPGHFRVSYLF